MTESMSMLGEIYRTSRLVYLTGRAVAHAIARKPLDPESMTGVIFRTQALAMTLPGHELEIVHGCESCQSVVVVDHGKRQIRPVMVKIECPIIRLLRAFI